MEQLLLHLFGDFILQTDNMALNKKKNTLNGYIYCILHCVTYSLPFILITNWKAVIFIGLTHFIIDKTNIVAHFLKLRNNVKDISNFGFAKERPFAITVWLLIFTDNTIHLILNYLAIKYIF